MHEGKIVTTKSGRTVKLSRKMEEFLESSKKSSTAGHRKELVTQLTEVNTLISQDVDPKEIQDKYKTIIQDRTKLYGLEEEETKELDEIEKSVYLEFFDTEYEAIHTSTDAVKKFLAQSDVQPHDSVSQSGKSNVSHTSFTSHVSMIIEEKTKQATLEAEQARIIHQASIDKQTQEIEQMRREMQQRADMYRVTHELELSKLKLQIIREAEEEARSHISQVTRGAGRMKHTIEPTAPAPKRVKPNPQSTPRTVKGYEPPEFESTGHERAFSKSSMAKENEHDNSRSLEAVFDKLTGAITKSSRHTLQIEPQVFNGDVLQYNLWKRNFEELVEQDVKVERRFIYLLKYTSGQARECIDSLTHLSNVDAYQEGMLLLDERYGDKFYTYEAIVEKLENWPTIKDGDGMSLRKFADFLSTCLAAMQTNQSLKILDTLPENQKLLKKLPRRLVDRWSTKVDDWQYKDQSTNDEHTFPPFFIFVDYLKRQARIELGPIKRNLPKQDGSRFRPIRTHYTEIEEDQVDCYATQLEKAKVACLYCDGDHNLAECKKFTELPPADRIQFSYKKQLCRGCLKTGHFAWECKELQRCQSCQGRHHSLFHDDNFKPRVRSREQTNAEPPKDKKVVLSTRVEGGIVTSHISRVTMKNGKKSDVPQLDVYAVIDNQSNACFISESVANKMGVKGVITNIELHTMTGVEDVQMRVVEDLVVMDKRLEKEIKLPKTYIRNGMGAQHDQIPKPEDVRKWNHLASIADDFEEVKVDIEVGLLIGRNCYEAVKQTDFIPSKGTDPYALKTALGWGIIGQLNKDKERDNEKIWVHTVSVKQPSPAKFIETFTVDFQESDSDQKLSQDDMKFLRCMKEGRTFTEDGHVMLPLPMKTRAPLPDNTRQARGSLNGLKKRFNRNPAYKEKYTAKMNDLLEKGYAEKAPKEYTEGQRWYWEHHGVFHPKKVEELRVVWNGSKPCQGIVFNQRLLQGPDQINSLVGVICRYRKEPITLTCDIEGMFLQVRMSQDDRDYLRFFWWPNGDTTQEPEEYRHAVHPFGATSSPGCTGYALLSIADQFEEKHGKAAADFIRKCFYVDDGVTALPTRDRIISLMHSSRALCAEGGFNLTKFSSNDKQVLESIPPELRAKNIKQVDLTKDLLPKGYTLGIYICNESDCITFQVHLKVMPKTRRGILSSVSQIYDPLGLAGPFVLEGKRILQELCNRKLDWDDPLPQDLNDRWNDWTSQIMELEQLKFPRGFSTWGVEASTSVELHHFADASFSGFGQCSYIRLTNNNGDVQTRLVMAKSKVVPKKQVTVPRLELAAACLSVKVARFLQEQLHIEQISHQFWTDSSVVLGYISNESKRFHVYVANRVATIREFTEPEQWHHVETTLNPADIASRGARVSELMSNELWMEGPPFLKQATTQWIPYAGTLSESDPEIKKVLNFKVYIVASAVAWTDKFLKFSTWKSLARGLAKIRQAIQSKRTRKPQESMPISADELKTSEEFIILETQRLQLKEELNALLEMKETRTDTKPAILLNGRLRKLDPFLDHKGVIRVGGRLQNTPTAFELKHPIIIPSESQTALLLLRHFHQKTAHGGRESTLGRSRSEGFWILAARKRIDTLIWNCVICKRYRGKATRQKMGNLPEERAEEVPPFTHVGVDFFGPYSIKAGRSQIKRWIVMYTCLVSIATHLDKAKGMSSDDFINSFRRFVARRGAVKTIRCDRGTNFVGAKQDLEGMADQVFDTKTRKAFADSGCEFLTMKFNPPYASHMGGIWERQIGTAKKILPVLLQQHCHHLDDDLLDTVIAETEAIMNSRPLTAVDTSDADALSPLSPAMLLNMKPAVAPPPLSKFSSRDVYAKRRWRVAQHIADEFWRRWRVELLPKWQERRKWTQQERNCEQDDIVLLTDDDAPRMLWTMGRVTQTTAGKDGLVRQVTVKTRDGEYVRPIHKLIVLVPRSIPVKRAL